MLSRIGKLLGGTVAVGTVALALAPAASAAALPKAIDFWGMYPVDGAAVRPPSLGWVTSVINGAGSFNGTQGSSSTGPTSNIAWSSWTATGASGSGAVWVTHLVPPNGQSATNTPYPAKLSFSTPKMLTLATSLTTDATRKVLAFTKMKISFTAAVPAGWHRSATFTLKREGKYFYFFDVPN